MLADTCISISEFKKNANQIIKDLPQTWSKFIFVNNKPVAVLLDPATFEEAFSFTFTPPVSAKKVLQQYKKSYGKKVS